MPLNATIEKQLLLHRAVSVCAVAQLRRAIIEESKPEPVIGESYREELLAELQPAFADAWPDHPELDAVEDLEAFLHEASTRFLDAARALDTEEDFVPAAGFDQHALGLTFQHLQVEIEAIEGGVASEDLWRSFGEYEPTEAIAEIAEAGIRIKLRAIGAFLTNPPSRYDDEVTAAQFFPAGEWERIRDSEVAERVTRDQKYVHKQVAHLTLSRPLPEDRGIYRPMTYANDLRDVMSLLAQFTEAVHTELIPEGWAEWLAEHMPGGG